MSQCICNQEHRLEQIEQQAKSVRKTIFGNGDTSNAIVTKLAAHDEQITHQAKTIEKVNTKLWAIVVLLLTIQFTVAIDKFFGNETPEKSTAPIAYEQTIPTKHITQLNQVCRAKR